MTDALRAKTPTAAKGVSPKQAMAELLKQADTDDAAFEDRSNATMGLTPSRAAKLKRLTQRARSEGPELVGRLGVKEAANKMMTWSSSVDASMALLWASEAETKLKAGSSDGSSGESMSDDSMSDGKRERERRDEPRPPGRKPAARLKRAPSEASSDSAQPRWVDEGRLTTVKHFTEVLIQASSEHGEPLSASQALSKIARMLHVADDVLESLVRGLSRDSPVPATARRIPTMLGTVSEGSVSDAGSVHGGGGFGLFGVAGVGLGAPGVGAFGRGLEIHTRRR